MTRYIPLLVLGATLLGTGRSWTKPAPPPPPKPAVYNYDYELMPANDVKVRIPQPPEELDPNTGEFKRYSAEELKKLKGDDADEKKMFGYKGSFSDLKIGDVVEVHLSTPKEASKTEEGEDPEKTSWKPSGKISGTVKDTAEKSFTVRVHSKTLGNGFMRVLDRQATLIIVQKRAAPPANTPTPKK